MASLGNMILFSFILAYIMMLGYSGNYMTNYGFNSSISNTMNGTLTNMKGSMDSLGNSTHINLNPFAGTFSFPNPFTIFTDIFTILYSMVSAPQTIIMALDLPDILKWGLVIIITTLEGYLVMTWFKGQGN
jgi:hypothetical protein